MGKLDGKVAIITGAGAGIAKSTALLFAKEGARVGVLELNRDAGAATEKAIRDAGGEGIFVETDVTNDDAMKRAVETVVGKYGRLDVMMNCAGGSLQEDVPVHEMDLAIWQRTIALNLLHPFLACRHGIPHMIKGGGGSIINFGSWLGQVGSQKPAYAAAKSGIGGFTKTIAAEYADRGIRCNAIAPGVVRTERSVKRWENKEWLLAEKPTAAARARAGLQKNYPFSVGEPENIATIALFLACEDSRMVTGIMIPADGGRSSYLKMYVEE